jgi:ABC-2 type transport system ATP-binding protein
MPATEGKAVVAGFDVFEQPIEAKRRTGYLPETPPLYPDMTVREYLTFVAKIKGVPSGERRERVRSVMDRTRIGDMAVRQCGKLSKGYKQRVGIAQALIHNPDVLILDEPTDGLDPNQKHEVRELIGRMAKSKIIVISTHLLEEVEAVCNRAIIIARGKILADDTPRGLEARSRFYNAVSLKLANPDLIPAARSAIKSLPEVASTELDEKNGRITAFPVAGKLPLAPINALAERQRWPLAELHLESGRLDEVFRSITGGATA